METHKGVLKGSAIRAQTNTSTAKFVRFLILFNYSASANTTRYCGFKFYSSRKTITSLYHKKANHTSAYDVTGFGASYVGGDTTNDVIEVINNAGNIRVPGDLLVGTSSTSSGYKLNLSGNMNMNNTNIHYANEVHLMPVLDLKPRIQALRCIGLAIVPLHLLHLIQMVQFEAMLQEIQMVGIV